MVQFWQFVILGLATGSLYAMTAHGIVLVYRGSGVLNLAQGAFGMIGAYLFYRVGQQDGWPTWSCLVLGIAGPAALSALAYAIVLSRLRHASPLTRLVATLGITFAAVSLAYRLWGHTAQTVVSPLPHAVVHPFSKSIFVTEDRLWLIGIAVAVTACISVMYRYTSFGRITEAVAENPRAAAALGYSPVLTGVANWALGGALASVTGILIAPILLLEPAALAFVVLRSLAAALIGRFTSFWVTLGGGLAIGVTESLLARFVQHSGLFTAVTSADGLLFGLFSGPAASTSVAFLAIIVVLAVGGRALPMRGELLDRLPALGTGRVRPWLVALGLGAAAVALLSLPDDWVTALTITAATAIVLLSVVVLTGYVGQLSLAQFALAGVGAWIAGQLVASHGWAFLPALVVGVLVAAPAGAVLAIPALRSRGVSHAVLTFGLAVCVGDLILSNSALTGGFNGTRVGDPHLFGWDVGAFNHPQRYGFVVVIALAGSCLVVANLRRSRTGRRLIAVRSNERAAAALGIDVARAKLYGFSLASGLAALGGVLLAFRQPTIAYGAFGVLSSFQSIVLTTIGGVGYVFGAVVGAGLAPGALGQRISDAAGMNPDTLGVISGGLLVAIVLLRPHGIVHRHARRAARSDARRWVPPPNLPADHGGRRGIALEVQDLTVAFGGVVALDHVSLRIEPGEVLGIIGPNGAGKTTLLDAITGFVDVRAGAVLIGGQAVQGWAPHRRSTLGLARSFQALELFDDLTVGENLLAACEKATRGSTVTDLLRPGHSHLSAAAWTAVQEFGLKPLLDCRPDELAYGQRRLVAIARAAAAKPAILLLDEPAAGLSELESRELGELIRHLAERGIAVAVIEHDMDLVASTCHRLVVLDYGCVIACGAPDAVMSDAKVIAAYLGVDPVDSAEVG
jgi:sulfate-transporting ATPase